MNEKTTRDGETAKTVAAQLRAEIVTGELAPGILLRQEDLAQRFNTSRMPIRDCLKILEREGLVVLPMNRSAQVAPLDPESFQEINEMRAVAEPLALKLAIPELTNRQIEIAEAFQDEAERADVNQFSKLNKSFHIALLTPCNRPRLLNHIATLNDLSERYFQAAAIELNYTDRSNQEHRELLAASRKRDVEMASQILESHISNASKQMLETLSARQT